MYGEAMTMNWVYSCVSLSPKRTLSVADDFVVHLSDYDNEIVRVERKQTTPRELNTAN
jgi:hypothetical protein